MPLRRLAGIIPDGIVAAAAPVTSNIVGSSNGTILTAIAVNWLSEPLTTYRVCSTGPSFAVNVAKSNVRCRWMLANGNGAFTTTIPDLSITGAVFGQEHVFCLQANVPYYGVSGVDYVFTTTATPPTWFSVGMQFWHAVNNQVGSDNVSHQAVTPTLKAATDWPLQLWVEKES